MDFKGFVNFSIATTALVNILFKFFDPDNEGANGVFAMIFKVMEALLDL